MPGLVTLAVRSTGGQAASGTRSRRCWPSSLKGNGEIVPRRLDPGSLPNLGLHLGPELDVALQVEVVASAAVEQGAFELLDLVAGVGDPVGDLVGDDADAVLIRVDQ